MSLPTIFERTSPDDDQVAFERGPAIIGGASAGFIATVATAIPILMVNREMLETNIAGLYGLDGILVAGLIAHLAHGTLFGVIFAFILTDPTLVRIPESGLKMIVAGIFYGIALVVVGIGFVMPVWLNAISLAGAPEVFHLTPELLAWHLLYGLVLGLLYPDFEKYSRR